jgi:hypothetical protein
VDLPGIEPGRVGGLLKLRVAEEEMVLFSFVKRNFGDRSRGARLLVAVNKILRPSAFKSDRLLAAETVFP